MHWLLMFVPVWILFLVVAIACYLFGARVGYESAVEEFNDVIEGAIQKGVVSHGDSEQQRGQFRSHGA